MSDEQKTKKSDALRSIVMSNEEATKKSDDAQPLCAIELSKAELTRTFIFLAIQLGFLVASPWAGGFHNKIWSMLDSSILISSIGITGLVFVLESFKARQKVFRVAIVLYVAAVVDMSVNVLLTGWLGWERFGTGG